MTDRLVMAHCLGVRIKMWKRALEDLLIVPPHFMVFNRSFTFASLAERAFRTAASSTHVIS